MADHDKVNALRQGEAQLALDIMQEVSWFTGRYLIELTSSMLDLVWNSPRCSASKAWGDPCSRR